MVETKRCEQKVDVKADEIRRMTKFKNIAGQVLTYNSKDFHWLNKKLDPERTINGFEKPFRKKVKNNQSKLPHLNKNH